MGSIQAAFAQDRQLEAESAVTTKHSTTIKGKQLAYTATAGTQPVWDDNGKVIASLFYTYYQRDDVKDRGPGQMMRPKSRWIKAAHYQ